MDGSRDRSDGRVARATGWVLLVIGLAIVLAGIAVWRMNPGKALHPLFGQVWGVSGGMMMIAGALLSRAQFRPRTESSGRRTRYVFYAGALSIVIYIAFVLLGIRWGQDGTMSDSAIYLVVPVGFLTLLGSSWGLLVSRGARPPVRVALFGILVGLLVALMPLWLWISHRPVFDSFYRG